jgi:mannose-1-phosphate guanylyltransferase
MTRGFHVVLLAGGSGTRFWPLSRNRRPKQFLALAGRNPLLLDTWRRMRRLVPPSRLWIVAPQAMKRDLFRVLRGLRRENLIVEPSPRDTGPAVALACMRVQQRDADAVVGVFPTDHVIGDVAAFGASVGVAAEQARQGSLMCLGVTPDRPATGFGYLKCGRPPRPGRPVPVERFIEKPDERRAKRFLRSGKYLWNAGMFVWDVGRFLDELQRTSPRIAAAVHGHLAGRRGAWIRAPKLSVDYAVMERARGVQVVPLDAGWDDVGSWDAAVRLRAAAGGGANREILVDSPGSAVFGDGRIVAVVDVPDVVVVDTPDALLVVSRRGSEKVRDVVDELRRRKRKELL